jgi:hypothetical protein
MLSRIASGYSRTRALINAAIALLFALLFTFITVRFAFGGGWFETILLAALTIGMWVTAIRWYRRFRSSSSRGSPSRAA